MLASCVFVWVANSGGILSSNDGSHLALGRALALRGETTIDPDRALTLEVDLAERGGHAYSDRPPGTAFAAVPAIWIGDRLDPIARARAVEQAKAGERVDPLPGPELYVQTYSARAQGRGASLVDRIASSVLINLHAALVGLLGLLLLRRLIARAGFDEGAQLFACASLGLATLWGPYSTALFAHVSAGTAWLAFVLGATGLRATTADSRDWRTAMIALGTGLAGAWAIACDYALILAVVPATLALVPWRRWPLVLFGTAPIAAATLAYHGAAFGHPLAIGYDFQTNFDFARERGSTFSGSMGEGLWVTWGLGKGAGMLAQSPLSLAGVAALVTAVASAIRRGEAPDETLRGVAIAALCMLPWVLAVALHRTPWGGGTLDHRYLVPLLPLACVGLAWAWARESTALRVVLVVLAGASAVLVWRHFLGWHEAQAFARAQLGLGAACVVALATLLATAEREDEDADEGASEAPPDEAPR